MDNSFLVSIGVLIVFVGFLCALIGFKIGNEQGSVCTGSLILIEEETDENETYAFMELHEPIEHIKNKKTIRLKIEQRNSR